ncbi:hypothetical protein [Leptotrichia sp.]|uniref:hypothetical protein n=1 Tax=Leptotrichia sp. TaxID=104608 RepID=UPI001825F1F3|nr:hypothetical protein [Leptotrichia sp.]MBB1534999.1 hypothetical protein [Leptotrichia sp.]
MSEPYVRDNTREIESMLVTVQKNLEANQAILHAEIGEAQKQIRTVEENLQNLERELMKFWKDQKLANRLGQAETRIVKIRQELDKKFGHYDIVRRMTTGILQATDIGIVKKSTIETATEEMMISTPRYWLAPCLVALSAWINDNKNLADIALKEALNRSEEKTSLFFALVCRRAGRKPSALKWVRKYLDMQSAKKIDKKTTILIDAYVNGILGVDSERVVADKISEWIDVLSKNGKLIKEQKKDWENAIEAQRGYVGTDNYKNLAQYSSEWIQLKSVLEGAQLHQNLAEYFDQIFSEKSESNKLKEEIDKILDDLVQNYDDEEVDLRKEERLETLVIKYRGDEDRAQNNLRMEVKAFKSTKNFIQLLTDISMRPNVEKASTATRKFAISLSKDWILDAYNDVIIRNRANVPSVITYDMYSYTGSTRNGENEIEEKENFEKHMQNEKNLRLSEVASDTGNKIAIVIGLAMLIFFLSGNMFLGVIGIIVAFLGYKKMKEKQAKRVVIEEEYAKKIESGKEMIQEIFAEVVDFRDEFEETDQVSEIVINFLETLQAEQYVNRILDKNSSRKINLV